MTAEKSQQFLGLGVRLRELRRKRQLSQWQAAEKLAVANNTYAAWERGKNAPRLRQLLALAEFYEVSTDELLGRVRPSLGSFSECGVEWRLAWSEPGAQEEMAADIWRRLVKGDTIDLVADELDISRRETERYVHDLVLHERVCVERVKRNDELERWAQEHFRQAGRGARLRDVLVADLGHIDSKLVRSVLLGYVAKQYFVHEVQAGDSVGICGGFTVSRMIYALRRRDCPGGIRVLPVVVSPMLERPSVSANGLVSALAYRHYDVGVSAYQLPFYPDETRHRPTSSVTRRILNDAAAVDFLFMGLGAPGKGALALDIDDARHDYLWMAGIDPAEIQRNSISVGNIMYYLVDEEAEQPRDFAEENSNMICSIGLRGLKRLVELGKRVVIISLGGHKANITRAAIQGGYANVLIIDDALANGLVSS